MRRTQKKRGKHERATEEAPPPVKPDPEAVRRRALLVREANAFVEKGGDMSTRRCECGEYDCQEHLPAEQSSEKDGR